MPGTGFLSNLAMGDEVTYGTPVARDKFVEIISESMQVDQVPIPKESMRRGSPSNFFLGPKNVAGTIELELQFEGYLRLLKHALGQGASVPAGADVTHTFTILDALPVGQTLELERDLQAFAYPGSKINELTISMELGILKMTLGIIAADETQVSVTAQTFPTEILPTFNQAVLNIDSVATDVHAFSVTLNNGLIPRFKFGSTKTKEPARDALRDISGEFTKDWEATDIAALYDKWIAGTAIPLQLVLTGGIIPTTAVPYSITIDLPRVAMSGESPKIGGPGLIPLTTPYQAFYDEVGAQDALKITVVNAESSI